MSNAKKHSNTSKDPRVRELIDIWQNGSLTTDDRVSLYHELKQIHLGLNKDNPSTKTNPWNVALSHSLSRFTSTGFIMFFTIIAFVSVFAASTIEIPSVAFFLFLLLLLMILLMIIKTLQLTDAINVELTYFITGAVIYINISQILISLVLSKRALFVVSVVWYMNYCLVATLLIYFFFVIYKSVIPLKHYGRRN